MALRAAERRRLVWLVVLAAVVLGLVAGWWAGLFAGKPTPESRAREATDELRERVRELTH